MVDLDLARGLAAVRLASAAFLAVWAIDKIIDVEGAARVFETFYGMRPPDILLPAVGVAQLALVAAFAVGWRKNITYLAVLLMHGASTLASAGRLATPYEGTNALFWAAVPTLAALWMLYRLRWRDRTLTLDF